MLPRDLGYGLNRPGLLTAFGAFSNGMAQPVQTAPFGTRDRAGLDEWFPDLPGGLPTGAEILSGNASGYFEINEDFGLVSTVAAQGNLSTDGYSLVIRYNDAIDITVDITVEAGVAYAADHDDVEALVEHDHTSNAAAGGFTIKCRPNIFTDRIFIQQSRTFADTIVFDGNGAIVENFTFLNGMTPIEITGFNFLYNPDADYPQDYTEGVVIYGGGAYTHVHHNVFTGTATTMSESIAENNGGGAVLVGADNITMIFEFNIVENMGQPVSIQRGDNHVVRGNTFTGIQFDVLRVWGGAGCTVGGPLPEHINLVTRRLGATYAANHNDAYQIGAPPPATPSTRNHIIQGLVYIANYFGLPLGQNNCHGIFIRHEIAENLEADPADRWPNVKHENISILDCVIMSQGSHQISANSIDGYTCEDNSVIRPYEPDYFNCTINVGTNILNLSMDNCVSPAFVNTSGQFGTNCVKTEFQNFVSPLDQVYCWINPQRAAWDLTLADLKVNAFGPLYKSAGQCYGSRFTAFTPLDVEAPDALTALAVRKWTPTNGPLRMVFDASLSADENGLMTEGNASFSWDMGDGTTLYGVEVDHTYPFEGTYDVTLTVTRDSDDEQATATIRHKAYDTTIFALAFDNVESETTLLKGDYTIVERGTPTYVADGGRRVTDGNECYIEHTGGGSPIWGMAEISVEMDLKLVDGTGNGRFADAYNSFALEYHAGNREAKFWVRDENATWYSVTTDDTVWAWQNDDVNEYTLKASYSSLTGIMQLSIYDSVEAHKVTATGPAGGLVSQPASATSDIHLGGINFTASASFDVFRYVVSSNDINHTSGAAGAPLLTGSTPADDAGGVATNLASIDLTFNKPIRAVAGSNAAIELRLASDDSVVEEWKMLDDIVSQITTGRIEWLANNQIRLNLAGDLAGGAEHYVTIPDNALQDFTGTAFAGISDPAALNFTTAA